MSKRDLEKIELPTFQYAIALGSNLGSSLETFEKALIEIQNNVGVIVGSSNWIETKPLLHSESPNPNQANYLNGVVVVASTLEPERLLSCLQKIERLFGRRREEELLPWGPRRLDLDIIASQDLIYNSQNLVIPHLQMHCRDFVLIPMSEVLPDWRHPILGKTCSELLKSFA
jgi:2-amino-4-hydroxy-6-hydroxymethyldihydropteridine diphosphokinase